jgi:hypothetical protein
MFVITLFSEVFSFEKKGYNISSLFSAIFNFSFNSSFVWLSKQITLFALFNQVFKNNSSIFSTRLFFSFL